MNSNRGLTIVRPLLFTTYSLPDSGFKPIGEEFQEDGRQIVHHTGLDIMAFAEHASQGAAHHPLRCADDSKTGEEFECGGLYIVKRCGDGAGQHGGDSHAVGTHLEV